jgi:serine acetyltransferase
MALEGIFDFYVDRERREIFYTLNGNHNCWKSSDVGAGSTINVDVPPEALALGRARQINKGGYAKRLRRRTDKGKS